MGSKLEKKLATLPKSPGVYFHKNAKGEILYIGKAANLRSRVRQYFQAGRAADPKTDILVKEIVDVDWTELETEVDALFIEAELVRRYQPRFNILLRDDKSQLYIRVDYKSDYPTVTFVRRPMDDNAEYFGPYLGSVAIKRALRYLRRAFPYAISRPQNQKRTSLHYHLGLDPGLEEDKTSLEEYRANLRKLMQYLKGNRVALVRDIEKEMKQAARSKDFESAARARNQLFALRELSRQILFSDRELQDVSRDQALVDLANLLGLGKPPKRIEGYDISHIQGSDTTASMVVFNSGVPEKAAYRKFKMRSPGNDDFGHIFETITRRLGEQNVKKWGLANLMLIDGGKGQLSSAITARNNLNYGNLPMIGLAKRFEEIIIHKSQSLTAQKDLDWNSKLMSQGIKFSQSGDFISVILPAEAPLVKLLQRIRDESHRFAVSYHTTLRKHRQTASILDEIPGIGPITRKKLIRALGSMRAVNEASIRQLEATVGKQKAKLINRYLVAYRKDKL